MDSAQQSSSGGNTNTPNNKVDYDSKNIKSKDDKQYFTNVKTSKLAAFFKRIGNAPIFKGKRFAYISRSVAVVALLVIGGLITYFILQEINKPTTLSIGNTTITKEAIKNYALALKAYQDENPGASFGSNLQEVAEEELILNAALKWYASPEKCDITVTNNDILNFDGFDASELRDASD